MNDRYQALRQAWQELTAAGSPFEIRQAEVRGIPMRVYAQAPGSVRDLWLATRAHGDKDYLVYRDERWTYAEAHATTSSVAAWLVARGVGPGDRVAIAMRNYPEWLLSYWATLSIGATAVGMNAWWTSAEMAYAIEDSSPKVIVCDAERLERLAAIRSDLPSPAVVGVRCDPADGIVPWSELRDHGGDMPEVAVGADADACIFYTSGTTGRPKGARLTHRGCVSNLLSLAFWDAVSKRARTLCDDGAAAPQDSSPLVSLVATPLFHVTANNCIAYAATAAGGTLVLMYKWDALEALRLIERERVTAFSGVPTMTRELLGHPELEAHDTSSLRLLGGGGAPLQPDLVRKVEGRGSPVRPNTGYGLTETSGIITANSADFLVDKPESVGIPAPCFEARCVREDGSDAPVGELGELWVRGPQVVAGYLNRPDASAEAITEGWFHTGDVARIDEDGFVFIVDRIKDMVLRGGENVYCSEVEAVLHEHPAVSECAVFGVPDERLGEEVGVAIVTPENSGLSAEEVRAHCKPHLAAHKIPRYVWLRSEALPRNANGKFLKRELRDTLDPAAAH